METITVPGAFDGWVTLLEKHGTMKLAGSAGAGDCARRERVPGDGEDRRRLDSRGREAEDARRRPRHLSRRTATRRSRATIFVQKNLARTFRTLAKGGRDAFYRGEIARAIVDYCQKNGGFLTMEDFAEHKSTWVEPISTTYRGHTLYEFPPNNQGLTALLLLNILEGIDLTSMRTDPARYYHTLIEATKIAFADRNRYIADPAFPKVPVKELLSKDYAAKRRALINPDKAIDPPAYGEVKMGSDTTYFTRRRQGSQRRLVHQQHLQLVRIRHRRRRHRHHAAQSRHRVRRSQADHPNRLEPGKRPFHTLIPAMVFKDGRLLMSYGVMGGDIQAQGHVQVLVNLIDRGLNLQQAIDAPRDPLHQRPRRDDGGRPDARR